jgi:hypothetical protein
MRWCSAAVAVPPRQLFTTIFLVRLKYRFPVTLFMTVIAIKNRATCPRVERRDEIP